MTKKTKVKTVGYLRVSTIDQSTEKFKTAILKYCNKNDLGKVEFVEEKVSGTKHWKKRKLGETMEGMAEGSILVVPELSRLARSIPQIYEIITALREKGITLHTIKENIIVNGTGEMNMTAKIQISMFAMIADLSRDFISIRTKEALQVKKAEGIKLGRPSGKSKLDSRRGEIEEYQKLGMNKSQIARVLDCDRLTYLNWLEKEAKTGN